MARTIKIFNPNDIVCNNLENFNKENILKEGITDSKEICTKTKSNNRHILRLSK